MRKVVNLLIFMILVGTWTRAQTNIQSTSPVALQVMKGNYDPALYIPSQQIMHPDSISRRILSAVSPDSLKAYLIRLGGFYNRNSGSDTVSTTTGIGAARRWVFSKFSEFSALAENRLLPSYLQFDANICGQVQHRNIFSVLPGKDTTDKSIVIIEAHMDSRCEILCDTSCLAQGIEDNASGTALVLELARVMSPLSFNHTIVFLVTIGEEQGLVGAQAFADFAVQESISIRAVQNNDIVGGVLCGQTSSPPSCPGPGDVDSLQIRIFSQGNFNSKHKGFARFVKLEYTEQLQQVLEPFMNISILAPEDRTGRGGDHIPFRQRGFTAIRFTSANEHGDGNPSQPGYADRQHSMRDTLGIDTDNDGQIDSFFVDFRYLARNVIINGNAAAMAAIGPPTPLDFTLAAFGMELRGLIDDPWNLLAYRIGIRTSSNDWDTVFTLLGSKEFAVPVSSTGNHIVSVASMDSYGIESIFTGEKLSMVTGIEGPTQPLQGIELLPNRPNPFDDATYISVLAGNPLAGKSGWIRISTLEGREIARLPITLQAGFNDVLYEHGYGMAGTYLYSLIIDNAVLQTRKMVFSN
jgi:hypothetical protein